MVLNFLLDEIGVFFQLRAQILVREQNNRIFFIRNWVIIDVPHCFIGRYVDAGDLPELQENIVVGTNIVEDQLEFINFVKLDDIAFAKLIDHSG